MYMFLKARAHLREDSCNQYRNGTMYFYYFLVILVKPTRCTNLSNLFWKDQDGTSWSCCCSKSVCMTYTIAECTVNNSWWWTEELSETCRVSFQNKLEKLVHLVVFIIRKFVTMHGHMNVKKRHNVCLHIWYTQLPLCTMQRYILSVCIIWLYHNLRCK
jgi:hypothetical protein